MLGRQPPSGVCTNHTHGQASSTSRICHTARGCQSRNRLSSPRPATTSLRVKNPGPEAAAAAPPQLTIVVPTYKEVDSLPALLDRIDALRPQLPPLELLIMDDDSNDGTEALIAERAQPWVTLVVRKADRGLSAAVLDGFGRARGDLLVCMDADLSHPPERIAALLEKLGSGFDFVVGSRYLEGGSTADDWGFLRWLNSRVATFLARPFTHISDPMSGFFALRRATFLEAAELNPVGYKIALELIVKARCQRVGEVPIHFAQRAFGESKLTLRQQLLYLRHLRRLSIFKFGIWSHLAQFLAVGLLGTFVNLLALTLFLWVHIEDHVAIGLAILVSMLFNFVLNRRFSFSYARGGSWTRQLLGFVAASSIGAAINYVTATQLLRSQPDMLPQLAALAGVAAGTAANFLFSRFLVFRAKHVRP
jgi:dolichol-phosphate mannosyltransferase